MSTTSGPGRIYAWITGMFADSSDPNVTHYFTAEDVTYGAVYSILILVLLTTWTWGVVNKWHIRSTRFRNTFLAYVLWLMVIYQWIIVTQAGLKGIQEQPCLKSTKGGKLVDNPRDCADGEGVHCSWNEPCTPCSPNYASVEPQPCAECREETARLCGDVMVFSYKLPTTQQTVRYVSVNNEDFCTYDCKFHHAFPDHPGRQKCAKEEKEYGYFIPHVRAPCLICCSVLPSSGFKTGSAYEVDQAYRRALKHFQLTWVGPNHNWRGGFPLNNQAVPVQCEDVCPFGLGTCTAEEKVRRCACNEEAPNCLVVRVQSRVGPKPPTTTTDLLVQYSTGGRYGNSPQRYAFRVVDLHIRPTFSPTTEPTRLGPGRSTPAPTIPSARPSTSPTVAPSVFNISNFNHTHFPSASPTVPTFAPTHVNRSTWTCSMRCDPDVDFVQSGLLMTCPSGQAYTFGCPSAALECENKTYNAEEVPEYVKPAKVAARQAAWEALGCKDCTGNCTQDYGTFVPPTTVNETDVTDSNHFYLEVVRLDASRYDTDLQIRWRTLTSNTAMDTYTNRPGVKCFDWPSPVNGNLYEYGGDSLGCGG